MAMGAYHILAAAREGDERGAEEQEEANQVSGVLDMASYPEGDHG